MILFLPCKHPVITEPTVKQQIKAYKGNWLLAEIFLISLSGCIWALMVFNTGLSFL